MTIGFSIKKYYTLMSKINSISFLETSNTSLIKIIIFRIVNALEIISFLILINYIKIYNLHDILKRIIMNWFFKYYAGLGQYKLLYKFYVNSLTFLRTFFY